MALSLGGTRVTFFGAEGGQAFGVLASEMLSAMADGYLDGPELKALAERLAATPELTKLRAALDGDGKLEETLRWLATPAGDIAALGAAERRRALSLLKWNESEDGQVAAETVKLVLEFALTAQGWLEIIPQKDAAPIGVVGISGSATGKLGSEWKLPVELLDKASFNIELSGKRSLGYHARIDPERERAVRTFARILTSAPSPFDLSAVHASLTGAGDRSRLDSIVIETSGGSTLAGALSASAPLGYGAGNLGGKLKLDYSIERKAAGARTTTIRLGEGGVLVETKASRQTDLSSSLGLGVSVTFSVADIVKELVELTDQLRDLAKEIAQELAAAIDLRETIAAQVRSELEQALGADGLGKAAGAALFDSGDKAEGALAEYLTGQISRRAKPWVADAQERVRDSARLWLMAQGLGQLDVGSGKTLSSAVEAALDKAFAAIGATYDQRIGDLADAIQAKGEKPVRDALRELGAAIGKNQPLQDVRAIAVELKRLADRVVSRADEVRAALSAASQLTIAINYVGASYSRETEQVDALIALDPAGKKAAQLYRGLLMAPSNTVGALLAAGKQPDGVRLVSVNTLQRLREASKASAKVSLAGFNLVDGTSLFSSDFIVMRTGNEVSVVGAAQAREVDKRRRGETQTVEATYLFAEGKAGDGKLEQSWIDGAVSSTASPPVPLSFVIRSSEAKPRDGADPKGRMDAEEIGSLLKIYTRAGLIHSDTAKAAGAFGEMLVREQDNKLQGEFEAILKISDAQLAAIAAAGKALRAPGLRRVSSEEIWTLLRDSDRGKLKRAFDPLNTMEEFCDHIESRSLSQHEANLRARGDRLAGQAPYQLAVEARRVGDSLAAMVEQIGAISAAGLPVDARRDAVSALKKTLGAWTQTRGGNLLDDSDEHVARPPLVFMRVMQRLSTEGKGMKPDVIISIRDQESEAMEVFSDAIYAPPRTAEDGRA